MSITVNRESHSNGAPVALPADPDATRRRFIAVLEDARRNMRRLFVCWRNCHGRECAIFGTVWLLDQHHVSVLFHDSDVCETIRIATIFAIHVFGEDDTEVA